MIKCEIIEHGGPRAKQRALKAAIREGMKAAILDWHNRFIRKHFGPGAANRYHYEWRSRRYLMRKQHTAHPKIPDPQPLELSGRLRRAATAHIRVTARGRKARGAMAVPSYAARRRRVSGPDMAYELTKLLEKERAAITPAADRAMQRHIDAVNETETRRL